MITFSLREVVSLLLFASVLLVVYGFEALLLTRYAWSRMRGRPGKPVAHRGPRLALHVLTAVGALCILYGYFIEPNWVEVQVMAIPTPKLKSTGFRVVHISDLHCDKRPRNEETMVRIVNGLKPDLIVATGDYLNHRSALPRLKDVLSRLDAPLGKFGVAGNLEMGHWQRLGVLQGTGFRQLHRETAIVTKGEDRIAISGLDFIRSDIAIDPVEALPDDWFNVFLFHTPDLIEDVSGRGVDLYLCGHTHGGQVTLPWYGALITFSKFGKKYESGLYRVGETMLYVNRGLGLEMRPGPQVRFRARPEIAVFDILPE